MDEIEIPEAIRENIEVKKSRSALSLPLIAIAILCLSAGGLLSLFLWFNKPKPDREIVSKPPATTVSPPPESTPAVQVPDSVPAKPTPKDLLGHLPYEVAPQSDLEPISPDSNLQLRSAAAEKFKQMQADAQASGVNLVAVSAFRTAEAQEQLFFGVKEQKVQDAAKRAEVSAPPGYSEHHTGYAVDIGDGNAPATHVEPEFADTAVFAWLQKNALKYSFEMSFPPDNSQGVSYEPWHWRFVGDRDSLETFYQVRN